MATKVEPNLQKNFRLANERNNFPNHFHSTDRQNLLHFLRLPDHCHPNGGLLTTDDADAQQVECDFLDLFFSCSDEFIFKGGSSKINLQTVAMDIFNLCLINSIVLEAQWIPRSLNERADLLSRFVDKDDWSVNPSIFRVTDVLRRITTPRFLGSILNLPPPAAAALTPWHRIGEMRTTGSALL